MSLMGDYGLASLPVVEQNKLSGPGHVAGDSPGRGERAADGCRLLTSFAANRFRIVKKGPHLGRPTWDSRDITSLTCTVCRSFSATR